MAAPPAEPDPLKAGRIEDRAPHRAACALAGAAVIAAGAIAAYGRTLSAPFLLDDEDSIVRNATIRHVGRSLVPPNQAGVGGRPLLNLTFALNRLAGGLAVPGYHLANLAIHVLAAWTLFALVRRTLRLPALAPRFGRDATLLALAVSAIWAWHPVQTASVTYVSERAESLAGLFYLLTLHWFLRGCEARGAAARAFFAGSVAACLAGAATKEVIATAPLAALLFDRTFVSGTFAEAWRRRRWVYLALALTWVPLGLLMAGLRARDVGFGLGVPWWRYARAECRAVVRYLLLAIWPHPLVFDYGAAGFGRPGTWWVYGMVLSALLAATLWSLARARAAGFTLAWFFLLLAPTSSIVPIVGQPMAENRLYLPLAGIVALIVLGGYSAVAKAASSPPSRPAGGLALGETSAAARFGRWRRRGRRIYLGALVAVAAAAAVATAERNRDYASAISIWRDTVAKVPGNPRAHVDLGQAYAEAGDLARAIGQYEQALRLKPDDAGARNDLGDAYARMPGHLRDALAQFEAAVRLNPRLAEARFNLGTTLDRIPGRANEAAAELEEAVRLEPDFARAHYNLGTVFERIPGRLADAAAQYQDAVALEPDFGEAYENLGNVLAAEGWLASAAAELETAVRLDPNSEQARYDLANVLKAIPGRREEAIAQYAEALRLKPGDAFAHNNLGNALNAAGRTSEAIGEYEQALRLRPNFIAAHLNLALALLKRPETRSQAVAQLNAVLAIDPSNEPARRILAEATANPP